jgi:chemotaxis protein MotB
MAAQPKKAEDKARPIYVKRVKKVAGGHHGGAWKVAYADFVTAMMAFFMVMWLITAVSKEQRAAIFDYFKNPSMQEGSAPRPAPGQNGPGGASTAAINLRGGMDAPRAQQTLGVGAAMMAQSQPGLDAPPPPTPQQVAEEQVERNNLEALKRDLEEAIAKSQALEPFKDQLLIDITPEGLRIQIVDAQNRAMFGLGSAELKDYTSAILLELASYLNDVPNSLSLSGHTDTQPYAGHPRGYSNWELSADRANAARRALVQGGLAESKIARVVGLSSEVLFDRAHPTGPVNRRISIVVMTKKAEAAAHATDDPRHTMSAVPLRAPDTTSADSPAVP